MLFENCLYFETHQGEEVDKISLNGHLGSYPISYYMPFKKEDAYIKEDSSVGFKTTIKEGKKILEERIKIIDLSKEDSHYNITVKKLVKVINEKMNAYPEDTLIHLLIGFFGDMMTIDDVQNEIQRKLKKYYKIQQISKEQADKIVETRKPSGRFCFFNNEKWVGMDNEEGCISLDEFFKKSDCINWLLSEDNLEELKEKQISGRRFVQIPTELKEKITLIDDDDDIASLGFSCKGALNSYEGFEDFYERLWVWSKTENNNIYIVVTSDNGNGYCSLAYTDMYIREIINDLKNY